MKMFKKSSKWLLKTLPSNRWLYSACKLYVNSCNGENNDDTNSNGELRFMQEMLPACRTVFDVGANVGHWAALALQINPSLNLHCFEPSPATFIMLKNNNFPSNVICNNAGLSATPGEANLFIFADGSGTNSLYQRQGLDQNTGSQNRQEPVRLDTLDHYCEQQAIKTIDFMKIDVEGHELEVLKGATNILRQRNIKIIQFEYGGCNIDSRVFLKDIWNYFNGLNYSFYKLFPRENRKMSMYSQVFENFQYANWVVIRND